ncbi:hypothetical protein ANCDUO_04138 [Ancylostoma duodenale]|uniref:Uncharacterized protein n=1 Tax=Ancylostoma duodenale TaxID=51022 RepID=A0A0C2DRZ2_9BILA|nr:hypothetical protein ANCDUO_04138 [Ancylostoma duodenale]
MLVGYQQKKICGCRHLTAPGIGFVPEESALTPGGKNDVLADLGVSPKTTSPQHALFATLYVGESPFGLYAMDVLVDKHTITYAPKYLGPPLLEGPSPIALSVRFGRGIFISFDFFLLTECTIVDRIE